MLMTEGPNPLETFEARQLLDRLAREFDANFDGKFSYPGMLEHVILTATYICSVAQPTCHFSFANFWHDFGSRANILVFASSSSSRSHLIVGSLRQT